MLSHALCAFIAPAVVAAAARNPWTLPAPTYAIPEIDNWSPIPTQAPNARFIDLFRRADTAANGSVCGYASGISTSTVTCSPGASSVCATNTYLGVHGCCDPSNMEGCIIPTTCVASTQMRTLCTESACSNSLTLKCTGTEAPECARWDFVYSSGRTTTFTEWGCAAKQATVLVERTPRATGAVTTSSSTIISSTSTSPSTTDQTSPTSLPATQSSSKPNNTGAIIGGAIGALVVVGAVATLIIWLLLRHRRFKRDSNSTPNQNAHPEQQTYIPGAGNGNGNGNVSAVTEFNPHGFVPVHAWHDDQKGWIGPLASPDSATKSPGAGAYGEGWDDDRGGGGGGGVGVGVAVYGGELGDGRWHDRGTYGAVEAGGRSVHEAPA